MYFIKLILLSYILFLSNLSAEKYSCIKATKKYESLYELPNNLLLSVSLTESGRRLKNGEFVSWPWTINVRGKGKYFSDKDSAIRYVKNYTSKGKRNLDIGCMQINYMYHPDAFNNFEEAFDPDSNVKWSATLLKELFLRFGSWKEAVGYYHSYRTSRRKHYSKKVFNTWVSIKEDSFYNKIRNEALLTKTTLKNNNNIEKTNVLQKNTKEIKKSKKRKNQNNDQNINNPYIMARMEKVKFFRNYFIQTRKN